MWIYLNIDMQIKFPIVSKYGSLVFTNKIILNDSSWLYRVQCKAILGFFLFKIGIWTNSSNLLFYHVFTKYWYYVMKACLSGTVRYLIYIMQKKSYLWMCHVRQYTKTIILLAKKYNVVQITLCIFINVESLIK